MSFDVKALRKRIATEFTHGWRSELEAAANEIDRLRAELEREREAVVEKNRRLDRLGDQLITARALAMEEAARAGRELFLFATDDAGRADYLAEQIRALAPLPAGLIAVEGALLGRVLDWLPLECDVEDPDEKADLLNLIAGLAEALK